MLFFIRYKGTEHRVRVESRRGQLYVAYEGGAEQAIDIAFYGNDCSFVREGNVFCSNIVGDRNDYVVSRAHGNLSFEVESEYKRIVSILRGQDLGGENHLYAKMPGKVVKILVGDGTSVEKGTPLLVIEAMKMENELRVPRTCTISKVCVTEGQAVETGSLLIELSEDQ